MRIAADFPVGVSISTNAFLTDTNYSSIVKRDFDMVTFETAMKHGQLVNNDGTFNFDRCDELVNAVPKKVGIFGHTLAWYRGNNDVYLNSIASGGNQPELLTNPGFENGLQDGWSILNTGIPSGTATISTTTQSRTGNLALKVVNPVAYGSGNEWKVRIGSNAINTIPGKTYVVRFYAKAIASGVVNVVIRSSTGSAIYGGGKQVGTGWQEITWKFKANSMQSLLQLEFGRVAGTYFVDDVSVKDQDAIASELSDALKRYIAGIVTRYKDKIREWDVVNELFTDNGLVRNNSNTSANSNDGSPISGLFIWSNYLPDVAYQAFKYAEEVDPSAKFFINDYGMEYSQKKLDAIINLANELKQRGVKVDGIGTQMHIRWSSDRAKIDNMFKQLAATGLLIRISELDISCTDSQVPVTLTEEHLTRQADMYNYVVSSYIKNVPASQRAALSLWGVTDKYSWQYKRGTDYPCIYFNNYERKPAYHSILDALELQYVNQ